MNKLFLKFLNSVEKTANKLPDPFFMFLFLAFLVLIFSWLLSSLNVNATHPATGAIIRVTNLLNKTGIQRIFTEVVNNFIYFPPLGLVLATILAIGVAEKSGFFNAALNQLIRIIPKWALTSTIIFAGVCSNVIADSGIIVLPPLGAAIFASVGRHPLAGLAAAFTGVVGGFSANIMITSLDPLLSGFTQSAAQLISPEINVYPTANYYFMLASSVLVTIVCTFVNNLIIEPRLGIWDSTKTNKDKTYKTPNGNIIHSDDGVSINNINTSSSKEKKALSATLISLLILIAILLLMIIPTDGILRDDSGGLLPFYKSIIPIIMIIFFTCGIIFGIVSGSIKNNRDVAAMMSSALGTMGSYIILAFAAGQFIAYFGWSNLGVILAINGADFLKSLGLSGLIIVAAFYIFSSLMNIFIYSASAKWAILSPVFVPMFMLLGYSPETAQAVYRVGDSATNIITPLLPYFPIILVFAKKYETDITFGKLLSTLMPYSLILFIIWGLFLILWIAFGIPLGPGAAVLIGYQ